MTETPNTVHFLFKSPYHRPKNWQIPNSVISYAPLEADKSEPEALTVPDSSMFVGMIVNVDYEGELFPSRIL